MRLRCVVALCLALGCASTQRPPEALRALDRMTTSPAAREVARDAPDAWAETVAAVARAREVQGDAPRLREAAEEATLTFEVAACRARVTAAQRRITDATRQQAEVDADVTRMRGEAESLTAEAEQLAAARERAERVRRGVGAPAAVPSAERVAVAAETRQAAELMAAAAGMLGAEASRVAAVRALVTEAERSLERDALTAVVAAGRAYTAAERLLSVAREARAQGTDGATLATALSASGGFDPRRDARGVVSVLRGLFAGPRLAPASRQRVETLARVIQAHGDVRVSLEVFVGGAVRAQAVALATAQGQSLAAELRRLGVAAERLRVEGLHRVPGGARPEDRVEVVLVVPGEP